MGFAAACHILIVILGDVGKGPPGLVLIRFLNRTGICFDDYIDFGSGLEFGFLALVVGHDIFDSDLTVQVIGVMNIDLCLLGLVWEPRLDDLIDSAAQFLLLLGHGWPPNQEGMRNTVDFSIGLVLVHAFGLSRSASISKLEIW
jgi:hypothetical protein